MPVIGTDGVLKNILRFGGGFIDHVNKTMKTVQKTLDYKITENITLTDHTLQDLAALGHPYARRQGLEAMGIHDPYWQVHKQSGRLLESKKGGVDEAGIIAGTLRARAWVMMDSGMVPWALWVIYGTSRMIPRDFLTGSLYQIKDPVFDFLSKELKYFIVNFQSEGTKHD